MSPSRALRSTPSPKQWSASFTNWSEHRIWISSVGILPGFGSTPSSRYTDGSGCFEGAFFRGNRPRLRAAP
jgi:hypothetical protein